MHLSQKRTEIVRGGSFEDLFSFPLFFLILMVSWAKDCIVTVSKAVWFCCRLGEKKEK